MKWQPMVRHLSIYLVLAFIGYAMADIAGLTIRSSDSLFPQPLPNTEVRQRPMRPIRTENYEIIADARKMIFNSDGVIPPALGETPEQNQAPDAPPVLSQLPLVLVGTMVHVNPKRSLATISAKGKSDEQKPFRVDDDIDGMAQITKIERNKVIFRNNSNHRLEYIEIRDESKINFGVTDKVEGDIVIKNDNEREIKRSDLDKRLSDLPNLLKQASSMPNYTPDGRIDGFRITSIMPGSVYESLGIKSNDIIKSVNGEHLDSVQKAMELYTAFKGSSQINLSVDRNGRTETMSFTVTQ